MLRRAALFADQNRIDGELVRRMMAASVFAQSDVRPPTVPPSASNRLADVERLHIEQVLRDLNGNVTQTAAALGIDRRTLQRKLKTYGLSPMNSCLRTSGIVIWIVGCGAAADSRSVTGSSDDPQVVVGLRLTEANSRGSVPQTRVVLVAIDPVRGRATAPVGVFDGACTDDVAMPGVLATVRCWWADSEATISVVRENDRVQARVRRVDDAGPSPAPASLPVQAGIPVVPLGALR